MSMTLNPPASKAASTASIVSRRHAFLVLGRAGQIAVVAGEVATIGDVDLHGVETRALEQGLVVNALVEGLDAELGAGVLDPLEIDVALAPA